MQIRGTELFKFGPDDHDVDLSKNFNSQEFRCHCGCRTALIHFDLIEGLQIFRFEIGKPLLISSGFRCRDWNKRIGGVRDSGHCKGYAADIIVPPGFNTRVFAKIAWEIRKKAGIKRIGCYDGYQDKFGFIHIGIKNKYLELRDGSIKLAPSRWGNW